VLGSGVRVGCIEDDDRNAHCRRALDALSNGFRIRTRDPDSVDASCNRIFQEVGHVLYRKCRIAQPLDVDIVSPSSVLHAFNDYVPERVPRAAVRDEGELVFSGGSGGCAQEEGAGQEE